MSDMEAYLSWLENTAIGDLPPGEDMRDLGALGEVRFHKFSDIEIMKRVRAARDNGRTWQQIALYLGLDAQEVIRRYAGGSHE